MAESVLSWIGGKFYIKDWIISHFPPHKTYVEVFGGAAHILLAKPKARREVYNDIDRDLVNFFICLRDHFDAFYCKVLFTPKSRYLFYLYREEYKKHRDFQIPDVDRAVKFYLLNYLSFSGDMSLSSLSFSTTSDGGDIHLERFETIAKRMIDVLIEELDFRELIPRYDSEDTLFYLDPPYFGITRYYSSTFTEKDHYELAELLKGIKGKFCLSYYETPEILKLYNGYVIRKKEVVKFAEGVQITKEKSKAIELLIMNYEPPEENLKLFKEDSNEEERGQVFTDEG